MLHHLCTKLNSSNAIVLAQGWKLKWVPKQSEESSTKQGKRDTKVWRRKKIEPEKDHVECALNDQGINSCC